MLELDVFNGENKFTGLDIDREMYAIIPSCDKNPEIRIDYQNLDGVFGTKVRSSDDLATVSVARQDVLYHYIWAFNTKTGELENYQWRINTEEISQSELDLEKHWELLIAGEVMSDIKTGILCLDRNLRRMWFKHYQRMILCGQGNRYVKEIPGTNTTLEIENGITAINNKKYTYKTQRPHIITLNMVKSSGSLNKGAAHDY